MSEETLHVNEFEKDTKPVYRSERNYNRDMGRKLTSRIALIVRKRF